MKTSWKAVVRDVFIICFLTFIAGLVVGKSFAPGPAQFKVFVLSNLFFQIAGFTIGGSITKTYRIKHLLIVAIGVWIVNVSNIISGVSTFTMWLVSLPSTLLMMLIGGGLSFLFVPTPKTAHVTSGSDAEQATPKQTG